jgi:hypothetical protein
MLLFVDNGPWHARRQETCNGLLLFCRGWKSWIICLHALNSVNDDTRLRLHFQQLSMCTFSIDIFLVYMDEVEQVDTWCKREYNEKVGAYPMAKMYLSTGQIHLHQLKHRHLFLFSIEFWLEGSKIWQRFQKVNSGTCPSQSNLALGFVNDDNDGYDDAKERKASKVQANDFSDFSIDYIYIG